MNELEIYMKAYGNVINQNAKLTADLALAHAQIDVLNEELRQIKNPETEQSKENIKNSDKEQDSK